MGHSRLVKFPDFCNLSRSLGGAVPWLTIGIVLRVRDLDSRILDSGVFSVDWGLYIEAAADAGATFGWSAGREFLPGHLSCWEFDKRAAVGM